MSSNLTYLKETDFENTIAVAGLPGIALIGKMAVEYLIQDLEAEKFAELTSDKFPGWAIRENGIIRDLKIYFHKANIENLDRELILITADAQASSSPGQHELSQEIVEMLSNQGVETIVTMAAFLDSEEKKSPIVGAGTDTETVKMLKDHDVGILEGGRIVGMNGLLVTMGAERGMNGFCLLGTTEGKDNDPEASKNVLSKFSEIFDLNLDISDFDEKVPDLPKFKPPEIKMPSGSKKKMGKRDLSYIR
ncbi:hypothetical protein AKJ49_01770 [candidate division MSBL1 archaeon SCGC-AAA382A03]|uniref:Proteasome assembly chaperone family protein n=1 Tax=candidate division MSBL1 archaeon SCGC-AAA382A03 TaxID=1698278 RepID=A0A133VEA2_9EURY|nr:hypothetical protein AKJ49_01770 [candidate division MSBL1 archaeon SCGC-AAA382A03]